MSETKKKIDETKESQAVKPEKTAPQKMEIHIRGRKFSSWSEIPESLLTTEMKKKKGK